MRAFKELSIIILIGFISIIFFWKFFFLGYLPLGSDIISYHYLPWNTCHSEGTIAQNPLLSDPVTMFFPQREIQMDYQRRGITARWNPYLFCGTPGIGSIPFYLKLRELVTYPPNILQYFVSPPTFYALITISYQFFAGLFMYLFLRYGLKLSRFGCLTGGIVFMLNGVFSVWLEFDFTLRTALWFPLILLLLTKTLEGSFVSTLLGGLFLRNLSPNPLYLLYFALIFLSYAPFKLFLFYREKHKGIVKIGLLLILFWTVWFLLDYGTSKSTIETISASHRGRFNLKELNALPNENLITLFVPDFYGTPANPYTYGIIRGWFYKVGLIKEKIAKVGGENYNEYCLYFGVLPLILSLLAGLLRKDGPTRFFLFLWIISLGSALGTFLYLPLYYFVPGISAVGISRILILFTFLGSILAGLGAENLTSRKWEVESGRWGRGIIRVAIGVLIIATIGWTIFLVLPKFNPQFQLLAWHFSLKNPSMTIPILLLLSSIIILIMSLKIRNPQSAICNGILKVVMLIVVSGDLLYFGMKYNPMTPKELLFLRTPSLNFLTDRLDKEPPFRIIAFKNIIPPNTNMVYRLQSIEGYGGLYPKRYFDFIKELVSPDVHHNWIDITSTANRKFSQLLNVKYILVDSELKGEGLKLVYNGEIKIYEDQDAFPRAWIVPEASVLMTKEEIFKELCRPEFDLRRKVILEEEYPNHIPEFRTSNLKPQILNAEPRIITYQPEKVVIHANLSENGFLVLSDFYNSGWKVFVDGKEGKMLKANYIMRAVSLNSGQHRVEFIYDLPSFKLNIYISHIILFLIILITVIFFVKRFN